MNKTGKASVFKTTLLVSLVSATFAAQAAGLGRLTVYSGIGQPLRAEVAISATPEEINGGITARLASHKEFSDAGIEFMPLLAGLRFAVDKGSDGAPVLRLATDAPVNEPFLHFLVELSWASGRVVREYTFLLDPPETLQFAKPAAVAVPAAPVARVEPPAPSQPAPSQPRPAPVAPAAVAPAAPSVSAAPAKATVAEIVVKPGDTLSKIAREHKVDTVSLDQMLVALFTRNREVFDGGNMNRLRAGRILRLPEAAEAAAVDTQEARNVIVAQAADFNEYRRRLASAALAEPAPATAPSQEAAGRIVAQVESKAPAAPKQDKLEVSRTDVAKGSAGSGQAGARGLEEDLIARDKALREAAERIAQLEKNIENLKQLVEVKSKAGAELQQKARETTAPQQPPAAPVPAEPAPAAVPPAPTSEQPAAAEPAKEAGAPPAVPAPAQEPVAEKPAESAPAPAPAKPAPAPRPATPPPPPPPEPSFIEENPAIVLGGGGILALLLGYLGYSAWRRKKKAGEAQEFAETADLQEAAAAVPALAVADSDAAEVSIQGDFSEGGVLTTEENVDPVAEADVLMAYGRDGQAEEILTEGLKSDPARTAIHLKLLELYANRKDADRFNEVAQGLHDVTQGQGDDWTRAASLARGLGVAGALFPAVVTATESATESVVEAQPEQEIPPVADVVEPVQIDVAAEAASETVILPASPLTSAEEPAPESDGSLDFDLDLGTTSVAPAAEAEAAKPAAEEVMSLDFDFDLGTPEPAQEPAPEAAPIAPEISPVAVDDAAGGIDFSLDLGSESQEIDLPKAADESVVPEAPSADAASIDFDLDLGSGDETQPAAASTGTEEAPVEPPVAKRGLSDEIEVDFDLELDAPPPAPVEVEPAPAIADISLDLGEPVQAVADAAPDVDLSLDVDLPAVELPPVGAAADLDSEASLDLPDLVLETPEVPAPVADDGALSAEADDPEVATKLELAQAYEEMGDREGARELLAEVLNEGSPAQRELAKSRLEQLG